MSVQEKLIGHLNSAELATEGLKVSPPAAVTGMTMFGYPIPELVQFVTLIYVAVMLSDKLYSMWVRYRESKNASKE